MSRELLEGGGRSARSSLLDTLTLNGKRSASSGSRSTSNGDQSARKKPKIDKSVAGQDASDLTSRLSSFLPRMKSANDALAVSATQTDHNIESVQDGEPYIEMDLGLGVLEEVGDGDGQLTDDAKGTNLTGEEVLDSLLKRRGRHQIGLIETIESITAEAPPRPLDEYLDLCRPADRPRMSRLLSLIDRGLKQLSSRETVTRVSLITKLNVLQGDVYKLMELRDELSDRDDMNEGGEMIIRHETHYIDELDRRLLAIRQSLESL
ncbi:hypothetical protein PYCC9005_001540 [Savitreella phatthalungensis]